ncbi:MAG: hypothetical protein HQL52_18475 [Magnetococcales bacterium]|nr:hypothetical protein [Magnetococcales bacterium]
MDARLDYFKPTVENTPEQMPVVAPTPISPIPAPALARKKAPPARKPAVKRRVGKEVVKSGMAASLAVTMLTGMKIMRPMSLHPVASWIFVGLTVAHTLLYEIPNKRANKR